KGEGATSAPAASNVTPTKAGTPEGQRTAPVKGTPTFIPGVTKITTVEGITEYRLANGLQVLLFPDQSKPTITVNITYLVGSRHKGYAGHALAPLLQTSG